MDFCRRGFYDGELRIAATSWKIEISIDVVTIALRQAELSHQSLAPTAGPEHRSAEAFWAKVISNSQATVALMRSGYGIQAFAIHRPTIEHFAYMYALLSGVLPLERAEEQNGFDAARVVRALEASRVADIKRGRQGLTRTMLRPWSSLTSCPN